MGRKIRRKDWFFSGGIHWGEGFNHANGRGGAQAPEFHRFLKGRRGRAAPLPQGEREFPDEV